MLVLSTLLLAISAVFTSGDFVAGLSRRAKPPQDAVGMAVDVHTLWIETSGFDTKTHMKDKQE